MIHFKRGNRKFAVLFGAMVCCLAVAICYLYWFEPAKLVAFYNRYIGYIIGYWDGTNPEYPSEPVASPTPLTLHH
jgi:hypothetical protein